LASAFAPGENWLRTSEATSSSDEYHRMIWPSCRSSQPISSWLSYLRLDVPVFEAFPEAEGVLGRLREAGVKLWRS